MVDYGITNCMVSLPAGARSSPISSQHIPDTHSFLSLLLHFLNPNKSITGHKPQICLSIRLPFTRHSRSFPVLFTASEYLQQFIIPVGKCARKRRKAPDQIVDI